MTDAPKDRRRRPRTEPPPGVALHIGPYRGRLLDVSDVGLRFDVDCPPEAEIAASATVVVGEPSVAVPVTVVWTRREGTRPPICGALVAADGLAGWRQFLATL